MEPAARPRRSRAFSPNRPASAVTIVARHLSGTTADRGDERRARPHEGCKGAEPMLQRTVKSGLIQMQNPLNDESRPVARSAQSDVRTRNINGAASPARRSLWRRRRAPEPNRSHVHWMAA